MTGEIELSSDDPPRERARKALRAMVVKSVTPEARAKLAQVMETYRQLDREVAMLEERRRARAEAEAAAAPGPLNDPMPAGEEVPL